MSLRILVSDLLAQPGKARSESVAVPLHISLPNASVDDEVVVEVAMRSLSDGIVARGTASAAVDLTCNRCLTEWTETITVPFEQVFRIRPDDEDDEMPLDESNWIDLEPVVHDEVSLGLPHTPLCRPDCRGLCPTCGTDLNMEPCDGHGEDTDSPFAALRDLFEF
jgi:uncharacterized protein